MSREAPPADLETRIVSFALRRAEAGTPLSRAARTLSGATSSVPEVELTSSQGNAADRRASLLYPWLRSRAAAPPCAAELGAVVAGGWSRGGSGPDSALEVGLEMAVRIADLIHLGTPSGRWHAAATASTIGAALTAGLCRGLDRTGLSNAVAFAACQAATLDIRQITVATQRAGWSAAVAIGAVESAARGMLTPGTSLSGPHGLLAVLQCTADQNDVTSGLWQELRSSGLFDTGTACRWHGSNCDDEGGEVWTTDL